MADSASKETEETKLEDHLHYRTCIVRAWREDDGSRQKTIWRYALTMPSQNVSHGFSSFQDLVDSMQHHLAVVDGAGEDSTFSAHAGIAADNQE